MSAAEARRRAASGGCPVCGRPADPAARPFCSPRCKDVDLHRWLTGGYAIPGEPLEPEPGSGEDR